MYQRERRNVNTRNSAFYVKTEAIAQQLKFYSDTVLLLYGDFWPAQQCRKAKDSGVKKETDPQYEWLILMAQVQICWEVQAREQLFNTARDFYCNASRYLIDNVLIRAVQFSPLSTGGTTHARMLSSITVLKILLI